MREEQLRRLHKRLPYKSQYDQFQSAKVNMKKLKMFRSNTRNSENIKKSLFVKQVTIRKCMIQWPGVILSGPKNSNKVQINGHFTCAPG